MTRTVPLLVPDETESSRTLVIRQLELYARDLRKALDAERTRARELETAYFDTVMRLMEAILARNVETGRHLLRVKRYVEILCTRLGWSSKEIEVTAAASMLHDVGKIAIPETILGKRGPLDDDERRLVQRHTLIGARILEGSPSPLLQAARRIALNHHECWDGSGYPRGLRGEAIPRAARVLLLADRYDALRSERSYKPPYTHERSCEILLEGDGRSTAEHFDPRVLTLFARIHPELDSVWRCLGEGGAGHERSLPEETPWG